MTDELRPVAVAIIIATFVIGALLIAGYFLTRRTRDYLLYLGVGFVVTGVAWLVPHPLRIILQCAAGGAFLVAVVAGIQEFKRRVAQMRAEEERRTQAFGEYLEAISRSAATKAEAANPPALPEE